MRTARWPTMQIQRMTQSSQVTLILLEMDKRMSRISQEPKMLDTGEQRLVDQGVYASWTLKWWKMKSSATVLVLVWCAVIK